MNLMCSNKTIKYLMFVFNFIFVITGIILLSVGVSVKAYYYPYDMFLDDKYFSLPNMLIATGSLIFFISFLGCYGAIRENWVMLMAFSILLAIIFIFELSVGIAGYVLRDKTSSYLESKLSETMKKYNDSFAINGMWDAIQQEFECCGVYGPQDWYPVFDNTSVLPMSCCRRISGSVGVFYCNDYTTPAPVPTTVTSTTIQPGNNSSNVNIETVKSASLVNVTTGEASLSADPPSSSNSLKNDNDTTISTDPTPSTTPPTPSTTPPTPSTTPPTPPSTTLSTTLDTNTTNETSSTTETTVTVTTLTTLITNETTTETSANPTTFTAYPPSSSIPYSTGCEAAFGSFLKAYAVDIGGVGIALAVLQLVGILFSFHLAKQLKNGYYST